MTGISIITVNYNSGICLTNCLQSILKNIIIPFEVIIWDNASNDDSMNYAIQIAADDDRIIVVNHSENLGFAGANNAAFEKAKYNIIHFLNPDTLVGPEMNDLYKQIISHSIDTVWVTSIKNDKSINESTTYVIPTVKQYFNRLFNKKKTQYWHIGASVIISAGNFKKIGMWCQDYFMYTEDMNLFYEIHRNHIPVKKSDIAVVHIGKVSSGNTWSNYKRALTIERSLKRFYLRYGMIWQYYLLRPLQLKYQFFTDFNEFKKGSRAFFKLYFTFPKKHDQTRKTI